MSIKFTILTVDLLLDRKIFCLQTCMSGPFKYRLGQGRG